MAIRHPKTSSAGYSLLEVVVATGITGIFLAAIASQVLRWARGNQQLATIAGRAVGAKGGSPFITSSFEAAGIAMKFQHLPIKIAGCNATEPCVRSLNSSGFAQLTQAEEAIFQDDSIEFYRDDAGDVDALNPMRVQKTSSAALDSSLLVGPYYVTWPLLDEKSPPLLMLKSARQSDSFLFQEDFATAIPPATPLMFFKALSPGVDASRYVNSPFLIYNGNSPEQFLIQVAKSAFSCQLPGGGAAPPCVAAAALFDPKYGTTRLAEVATLQAFDFKSLENSDFDAHGFVPNYPTLQGRSGTEWNPGQGQAFYGFPTSVFSILDAFADADLAAVPVDVRRVAHYYHTHSYLKGKLMAIPIETTMFYLKRISQSGQPAYQLMAKTFLNQNQDQSLLVIDGITGDHPSVTFARKIGTTELNVFVTSQ